MERDIRSEVRGETDGAMSSDGRAVSDIGIKQEMSSTPAVDGVVPASAMQQILPLQLLHASTASSGSTAASLSWMMSSPYPMMMLPGTGVPQQLILPGTGSGGVLAMHDGQLYVSPIADSAGASELTGNELLHAQHYPTVPLVGSSSESASLAATHRPQGSQTPRRGAADAMKPPKKPLTPYMIFSKRIWPQVKAENAHLSSVCELGAIVGSLWRDLDPTQKQEYNELYAKDKARYDEELRNYLKQTGLLASDLAKMRSKRPPPPHHRPPLLHGSDTSASHSTAWSNGRASPRSGMQQPSTATLPTLYANHDGSVIVGSAASAAAAGHTYSDSRSWTWSQPVASLSSGDGGMVMYQMPPASVVAASGEKSADNQERQNGLPVTLPPEYSAAKSLHQLGADAASASTLRIEQLEAEVQRLRAALAEKTVEAQNLQHELHAALHSIEKYQLSQKQQKDSIEGTAEVAAPCKVEPQENSTAVSSPD